MMIKVHGRKYNKKETTHVTVGYYKTCCLCGQSNIFCNDSKIDKASRQLSKLHQLTSVEISAPGLSNISSLRPLVHLKSLQLGYDIVDLSPLSNFTNLETLRLPMNCIVNIEPLRDLVRLRELDLWKNNIVNIEPLRKLTRLERLDLHENPITNAQALHDMIHLNFFGFGKGYGGPDSYLPVTNYSSGEEPGLRTEREIPGVKRVMLIIMFNTRSSIGSNPRGNPPYLAHGNGLHEDVVDVYLYKSQITDDDLTIVARYLSKTSNSTNAIAAEEVKIEVKEDKEEPSIGCFYNKLEALQLQDNELSDIGPLAKITQLKKLDLSRNKIVVIDGLSSLLNLQALGLGENKIVDVGPLAVLTHLKNLHLENNQIVDISALTALLHLELLNVGHNFIANFLPLIELKKKQKDAPFQRIRHCNVKNQHRDSEKDWMCLNMTGPTPSCEKTPCKETNAGTVDKCCKCGAKYVIAIVPPFVRKLQTSFDTRELNRTWLSGFRQTSFDTSS